MTTLESYKYVNSLFNLRIKRLKNGKNEVNENEKSKKTTKKEKQKRKQEVKTKDVHTIQSA